MLLLFSSVVTVWWMLSFLLYLTAAHQNPTIANVICFKVLNCCMALLCPQTTTEKQNIKPRNSCVLSSWTFVSIFSVSSWLSYSFPQVSKVLLRAWAKRGQPDPAQSPNPTLIRWEPCTNDPSIEISICRVRIVTTYCCVSKKQLSAE